jgi:hypothetical protein
LKDSAEVRDSYRTLVPHSQDNVLLQEQFNIETFTGVLVYSPIGCGFSRAAFASIGKDSVVTQHFDKYAHYILSPFEEHAAPASHEEFDYLDGERFFYVYSKAGWPIITYWGSPGFYFVKDGQPVQHVVGWPRDREAEWMQKLAEGFAAIEDKSG